MKFECEGCKKEKGKFEYGENPEGIWVSGDLLPEYIRLICNSCLRVLRKQLKKEGK